jgi:hypothetical protein
MCQCVVDHRLAERVGASVAGSVPFSPCACAVVLALVQRERVHARVERVV